MSKSPVSIASEAAETPLPHPVPAVDELGPLVGKVFGGYEITSYIGEGPTGQVYRAEDLVGGRMAVKVMHRELSRKDTADKLWADMQKLATLGLPQLAKIYDAGFDDDGQFYYTMDELPGADLEAGLEEAGALAPSKALEIVRQICRALEAAHEAGIVHGGIKPRNVFLVPEPSGLTVKLLDFGASRLAGGAEKGVVVGNPFYMAPEQFGGNCDPRTDVYSLGVLMYELFSGTLPFAGPSHGQVMMRHLAEQPAPPPGVDEELQRIILRALVKAPAGRYGSVKQLATAIERWAASAPALLQDSAGFAVVHRAKESQAMKQQALSAPDATAPMPKMDLAELARNTRLNDATPPPVAVNPPPPVNGGKDKKQVSKNGSQKPENPNSSESVEASLEDFINQANASFPATTDGWDLHTGDVELLEEASEQFEKVEHVSEPAKIKVPAAAKPAPAAEPKRQTKSQPAVIPIAPALEADTANSEAEEEPAALEPPPSGPKRKFERTEVVSSPIQTARVPWSANPLVIIGGLLVAFVVGAGLVFFMVRTMMPTQPVVVQAPPPQIVVQPQPTAQPVVTPLPSTAAAQPAAAQPSAQPVVTPLPSERPAPAPVEAAPAPAPRKRAVAAKPKKPAEPREERAPAEKPARAEKKAAPVEKAEKPAAKPAKKESKGSDWVDPFAQ